nr:PREDICTED: uncharacterized protein DKFZp434B061-like [Bemisia tabaci]
MSRPQPSAKPATNHGLPPVRPAAHRVHEELEPLRSQHLHQASAKSIRSNPRGIQPPDSRTARVPRAFPSKRAFRASPPSTLTDSRSRQPPAAAGRHPGRKPPRPTTPVRLERKHHASVRRKTSAPLLTPLSPALTTSEWRRFLKTCSLLGTPSVLSPLPPTPPRPRPTSAVRPSPIIISDDAG